MRVDICIPQLLLLLSVSMSEVWRWRISSWIYGCFRIRIFVFMAVHCPRTLTWWIFNGNLSSGVEVLEDKVTCVIRRVEKSHPRRERWWWWWWRKKFDLFPDTPQYSPEDKEDPPPSVMWWTIAKLDGEDESGQVEMKLNTSHNGLMNLYNSAGHCVSSLSQHIH